MSTINFAHRTTFHAHIGAGRLGLGEWAKEGGREGGRGDVPRRRKGDGLPSLGRVVDNSEGDAALNDGRDDQAWRKEGREGGRKRSRSKNVLFL